MSHWYTRVGTVALVVVLAACSSGSKSGAPTTTIAKKNVGGCPGSATTGIVGTTIKIGTSLPESGPDPSGVAILQGERAYFDYVNRDLGGVAVAGTKYQIQLVDRDDASDPTMTAQNATTLVSTDKVFAMFGVPGTAANLAIRTQLNAACVPDLFAASGSPAWGNPKYPWLIGGPLVPYSLESQSFVDYLNRNRAHSTVAILASSDDIGTTYLDSFEAQVGGTTVTIAKSATYTASSTAAVASDIATLATTKADALLVAAPPAGCAAALAALKASAWKPITYVPSPCVSPAVPDGAITTSPFMDPSDPEWAGNAQMQQYKTTVPKYEPAADLANRNVGYGWTAAAFLVETLKRSPALDRTSVMSTARGLSFVTAIGLLVPNVVMSTARGDNFLGESYTLMRYHAAKQYLAPIGQVQNGDGLTPQFTPPALINQ